MKDFKPTHKMSHGEHKLFCGGGKVAKMAMGGATPMSQSGAMQSMARSPMQGGPAASAMRPAASPTTQTQAMQNLQNSAPSQSNYMQAQSAQNAMQSAMGQRDMGLGRSTGPTGSQSAPPFGTRQTSNIDIGRVSPPPRLGGPVVGGPGVALPPPRLGGPVVGGPGVALPPRPIGTMGRVPMKKGGKAMSKAKGGYARGGEFGDAKDDGDMDYRSESEGQQSSARTAAGARNDVAHRNFRNTMNKAKGGMAKAEKSSKRV